MCTEQDIFDHFDCLKAEIDYVKILRSNKSKKTKNCGYIGFKSKASIDEALKKHHTKLNGNRIGVVLCLTKEAAEKKKEKLLRQKQLAKKKAKKLVGKAKTAKKPAPKSSVI